MSTQRIKAIIDGILEREGGFSNHRDDRGGRTMHGITEEVARSNGYGGPMETMPVSVARSIYEKRYVLAPRFDDIIQIDPDIGEELVDTGVNMGPAQATMFLQRALNLLNEGGKRYSDLFADGKIGPVTLDALRTYLAWRGENGKKILLRLLNAQQAVRYMELAEKRPANESFMNGWILQRVGME